MRTNCKCVGKDEQWHFDRQLGCWYVERNCDECSYYFEGPDHSKTNINILPTGFVVRDDDYKGPSLRERDGEFAIYCYDDEGRYGLPVRVDDVQGIFDFCELNKFSHKRIRIITKEDEIAVSVTDGKYEFPPEWKAFNNQ